MKIKVLPDALVNQIAAGEVVERPASVVRELLDNALDAGAHTIDVVLKDGGRQLIRVADDGCGMDRANATLCLQRHATSKITCHEDLFSVQTLGFRGEAIPSIASVSRFELSTRPAQQAVGSRLLVEGGRVLSIEDAGLAAGTEINVRNLFYNVPVRRKFLRTPATEMGHCMDVVLRAAMCRPDVSFRLTMDTRDLIRASVAADQAKRIHQLLGPDGRELWPVSRQDGELAIVGHISPPRVHRSSPKNSLFLMVNQRPVQDPVLRRAVNQAVQGCLPKGRYPVAVLFLAVPANEVDVNVHPAKTEVRFRDPRRIAALVTTAIVSALSEHGIRATVPFEGPSIQEMLTAHPLDDPTFVSQSPTSIEKDSEDALSPLSRHLATPFGSFRKLAVLGTCAPHHLAAVAEGRLFVIDLLAALTWLTLHDLRRSTETPEPAIRPLPDTGPTPLSERHTEALCAETETLKAMGFCFSRLSPTSIVMIALPQALWETDPHLAARAVSKALLKRRKGDRPVSAIIACTLAKANVANGVPALSNYDLRAMMASLDEVRFDPDWQVSPLWVCIETRP